MIWRRGEADLLVAAVAEDAATATAAWRRWQAAADLDTLPVEQHPLLPRLYANLTRLGLAAEADPRLKGIYRRSWYRNQRAINDLDALLADFDAAGILLNVIGATAACLICYPHIAERPIEQLEVLIPPASLDAALDRLLAAGWRSDRPVNLIRSADYRRWQHRATLRRPGDPLPLSLHWRLFPDGPIADEIGATGTRMDAENASDADYLTFSPRFLRSPRPVLRTETQLVLAGAAAGTGGPGSLLAAADLGMMLQGQPAIAWEQVAEQARRLQTARRLQSALAAVGALLVLPIPADVLAQLDASGREELAPAIPPAGRGLPGRARYHVQHWRRITHANGDRPTVAGLLCYLQIAAGETSLRGLVRRAAIFYTSAPA